MNWKPNRVELVGGGLMGIAAGGLGFVLPVPSWEVMIIWVAVSIPAAVFIRRRWGEAIDRWADRWVIRLLSG